jgi:hypothetical protein
MKASELVQGSTFIYSDVLTEVLREREDCTDRFGRSMWRFWCRRSDTNAEGWVMLGYEGVVTAATPTEEQAKTTNEEQGNMITTDNTPTTGIDAEPIIKRRNRSVAYLWPVRPAEENHRGPGTVYAELYISHHSDRKVFWTSTHPTTIYDSGTTSTSISLMAKKSWGIWEPVARYSEKALNAFTEKAVAAFREAYAADDESILALFVNTEV